MSTATQVRICNVDSCKYEGVVDYYGFWLCLLHDHDNVKAMLHDGDLPGGDWSCGHPIVVPSGPLREEHFKPRFGARSNPLEDSRLQNIPEKPIGRPGCIPERFRLV